VELGRHLCILAAPVADDKKDQESLDDNKDGDRNVKDKVKEVRDLSRISALWSQWTLCTTGTAGENEN
jgi:hypothetical protein